MGSNPIGDAKISKDLLETPEILHGPIWSSCAGGIHFMPAALTIFTNLLCASLFWELTACM